VKEGLLSERKGQSPWCAAGEEGQNTSSLCAKLMGKGTRERTSRAG
jgi:hypothetical protein